ncbi:MAG: DUF481 domain-containing protein [Gracilimonas sp.]|uniref:DUF481 domain-containing protein n=1 Tax=Gracilimonas TaxID=649462 RepID=UPI001B0DEB41|nr:DUF481 domain-containing protein [Gracilimonas sp.]MBO6585038.1 DUF481 domain-containing protein [Gracilimonas sp.]MBO6615691.1 DUF481 domain-containing protein [Gracilimonas sp.]
MLRFFQFSILSLFLIMISPSALQAQLLNVESVRSDADSAGWYGQLNFNLSLSQYNDRVLQFTNKANLSYFSDHHAYLFLNNLKLVNLDGASVISSGYSHLRSTFNRENRFSPEVFFQYQYNNNLGLQNRFLGGAGFRYTLFDGENWTGSFSTGLMAEYEQWQEDRAPAIDNRFIKSTSNLSLRGNLNSQTTFLLIGYYQARPNQFFQARSILETQLQVKITRRISMSVQFSAAYDADPVIDIPNWTYELSNGLIIKL